ncbi:hypothetical protein FACS1894182_06380 [Bacteroidia bacterium]|nr:hypothetical protein FACS1894182_06380 [Bacteroidia bacterium]
MRVKNALLAVSTGTGEINIGDYIQALAASQFFDNIDFFIERENLHQYDGEYAKMIMNGWFMDCPENWPPSEKIMPKFIAFHINSLAKEKLLSDQSIKYLKKHEPIGCRDENTMLMLKEKGIKAYFSGCLTLTLGEKYSTNDKEDMYYFVDPYFITRWNVKHFIRNFICLFYYWKDIKVIATKYFGKQHTMKQRMVLTTFYLEYKKYFSRDLLLTSEYIHQQSLDIRKQFPSNDSLLLYAENLVEKYARAKLVITSRIHCALPCLGLGTPVIYIENVQQLESSACRMNGLVELFNVVSWNKNHLELKFKQMGKIDKDNYPINKFAHKDLIAKLIASCKDFADKKMNF